MNPQKLAGQCAKLKCCINYEVDGYVEAQKRLPSREIILETKESNYYHFKTDIYKREITYSTDRSFAANLISIPADRAFDVIGMNKKGMRPVSLEADTKPQPPKRDAQDILGQDSVTRFDSTAKKKKKKRPNNSEYNGNESNGLNITPANTENAAPAENNNNGNEGNNANNGGGNNRRNNGNNNNNGGNNRNRNNRDRDNNRGESTSENKDSSRNNKDNNRENNREANRDNNNRNNRPKQKPKGNNDKLVTNDRPANNEKRPNNDKPSNNDRPQQPAKPADKPEPKTEA